MAEGVAWPLLLHASSGHWPGSTVLQLVSTCPKHPLLIPLSQMGRQTPSLPACPAASLETNKGDRRKTTRTKHNKKNQNALPPQSRTQTGMEEAAGEPLEVPPQLGLGAEVEPQSGVGWG